MQFNMNFKNYFIFVFNLNVKNTKCGIQYADTYFALSIFVSVYIEM